MLSSGAQREVVTNAPATWRRVLECYGLAWKEDVWQLRTEALLRQLRAFEASLPQEERWVLQDSFKFQDRSGRWPAVIISGDVRGGWGDPERRHEHALSSQADRVAARWAESLLRRWSSFGSVEWMVWFRQAGAHSATCLHSQEDSNSFLPHDLRIVVDASASQS